jgi:hypothetical protein
MVITVTRQERLHNLDKTKSMRNMNITEQGHIIADMPREHEILWVSADSCLFGEGGVINVHRK